MNEKANALLVVEGDVDEPELFKKVSAAFGLNVNFYTLGTNIYRLYQELKALDFQADIRKVLADIHPDQKEVLNRKYAYTYLIFDLDPHHGYKDPDGKTRSDLKEQILGNMLKAAEMVGFFTDETDPTIGKLYINYPMFESFRDCDRPFDSSFRHATVGFQEIPDYKKLVSTRQMSRKHVQKLAKKDLSEMIRMHTFKAHLLMDGKWSACSYAYYQTFCSSHRILEKQTELAEMNDLISVLNTSLFLVLDYFGNRDGFFDRILGNQQKQ